MTTESGTPRAQGSIRDERLGRLAELDERILALIGERSSILAREAAWRRSKGKSATDPSLEKHLWKAFEAQAKKAGLDRRMARQVFNLLNLCPAEEARPQAARTTPYVLAPRRVPLDIDLPGPRSLALVRNWVALAAAANLPLRLAPVILNDPLVDLVKALNQAGAHLSWAQNEIVNQPGQGVQVEGKVLFTGDDPANLYLLIALCLAQAGRVKLTGGGGLKLMDAGPLNQMLPNLGARLVPLNPHSHGLPARLECGGDMAGEVSLPQDAPPEFAAALILAGWSYPQGLTLRFSPNTELTRHLRRAVWTLKAAGIQAELDETSCSVSSGVPRIPVEPDPPLDPVLTAYLLALPALADGRVELSGRFHPEDPVAAFVLERLDALGLDLDVREDSLAAKALRLPDHDIRIGQVPELLPLALVMALRAKRPVRILLPGDEPLPAAAEEFLTRLGANFEAGDGYVETSPSELSWSGVWTCPDPYFALGLALASFLKPGLAMDNPGVLTALWPQFLGLYNALPTGRSAPRPDKEKTDDDKPTRRRIKL